MKSWKRLTAAVLAVAVAMSGLGISGKRCKILRGCNDSRAKEIQKEDNI